MPESEGLIRREVLDARKEDWLGSVRLPSPDMAWPMTLLAAAAVVALMLVMAFASVSRKERVSGRLVPAGGLQTIAAATSGVLTRRLVDEGQAVSEGQALFEISPDLAMPGGRSGVAETVAGELERQRRGLQRDLDDLASLHAQRAAGLEQEIASLRRQLASAITEAGLRQEQAAAATQMLERIRPLQEQQIVSAVQVQQYRDQALGAQAQLELATRARIELERQLADARQQLQALPLETAARRTGIERDLAGVAQAGARNQAQRAVAVHAPGAGVVSGLAVSQGQAVAEGDRLASIIPDGAPLVAELWVPSRAIGTLAPGDRVALRYHAFPHQKFGQQQGRIVEVATSAALASEVLARTGVDPGAPAYRVLVELDRQDIQAAGRRFGLRASMSLEADLLLERRRLYEYVLRPLDSAAPRARDAT